MAINVIGDYYSGTTGADSLSGGSWSDIFHMTADDYVMDYINGGAGSDTVDYSASQVGVKITLTEQQLKGGVTGGTVEADFVHTAYNYTTHSVFSYTHHQVVADLTSIENATGSEFDDVISGNSTSNVLRGGAGNDIINGGGGNDTIYSGFGADMLTGGLGNDTFVFTDYRDSGYTVVPQSGGGFNTINHGIDQIQDFTSGVDKIDLSQIDADTTHSGNQAFHIVDQLTGHAGELKLFLGTSLPNNSDQVSENFFTLQGDVNGDGIPDFELHVTVNLTFDLTLVTPTTDFLL